MCSLNLNFKSRICKIILRNFYKSNYENLYQKSIIKPIEFWNERAKKDLKWFQIYNKIFPLTFESFNFFDGGKINAVVNCIDRHKESNPDKIALILENDELFREEKLSYLELYKMTNRIGNVLKRHDVKKGDRVTIYLPNSVLAVACMLACARIGAIHCVVFAGFSAAALSKRMIDSNSHCLITCDVTFRGGRKLLLYETVKSAISLCPPDLVRCVLIQQYSPDLSLMKNPRIEFDMAEEMEVEESECAVVEMNSEDFLFLLYTSGSTGQPKGIVHSHASYLLYSSISQKVTFDFQANEIFACMADIGWITGHTFGVYATLANNGTSLLFSSLPTYPDSNRYWRMIERHKINHFYTSPTALRLLIQRGDSTPEHFDLSSLKTLGSGEPINHEAWQWYYERVGRKRVPILDTYWQTETGSICLSPQPFHLPSERLKPSYCMRPFPGIQPLLFQENGQIIAPDKNNVHGALCFGQKWPGMAKTIWNNANLMHATYFQQFPGFFCTGDEAYRDSDGHYRIVGRLDDVINSSGHRIASAEIEDVLDDIPEVAESAIVGCAHETKGESIYAFVTLKKGALQNSNLKEKLLEQVKSQISSFAVPHRIIYVKELPKTRSGKILRRILKKLVNGDADNLDDVSTLQNPHCLQNLAMEVDNRV